MAKLHIIRVSLTAHLKISEQVLTQHLAASPRVVGEELARQVDGYVREHKLGYYPALESFDSLEQGIDADLIDTVRGIAWFVGNLAQNEVEHRLRVAFSDVSIQDLRLLAFTMPQVRPNQPNALHDLAKHFTPDTIKAVMELSSIEKRGDLEGMDKLAEHKVVRWLEPHFESVEVTTSHLV